MTMDDKEEMEALRNLATAIDERRCIEAWITNHGAHTISLQHFQWDGGHDSYGHEAVRRGMIRRIEKQWHNLLMEALDEAEEHERHLRERLNMSTGIRQARL